jgi:hypothetical protein
MPHVLHFEAKRNGATAFLESNNLLGTLVILDAFSDPFGNFWASSKNEFVLDAWLNGDLEPSKVGALNSAAGRSHPTVTDRKSVLGKHGAIEHLPRKIVDPLYQDKELKPPKGVYVYHITGVVKPCDDLECELHCHKFLKAGEVKVFYTGAGDTEAVGERSKETLHEPGKESLPEDKDSKTKDITTEDSDSTPSGVAVPVLTFRKQENDRVTTGFRLDQDEPTVPQFIMRWDPNEKDGEVLLMNPSGGVLHKGGKFASEKLALHHAAQIADQWTRKPGSVDWFHHWAIQTWNRFRPSTGRDKYQMEEKIRAEFATPFGYDDSAVPQLEAVIKNWLLLGFRLHNYSGIRDWFTSWRKLDFQEGLAPWISEKQKRETGSQGNRAGNYVPQTAPMSPEAKARLKASMMGNNTENSEEKTNGTEGR